MRRFLTGLLVGGVILLAALAAADAFRSEDGRAVPSTAGRTNVPESQGLEDVLRRNLVIGLIFYSDEECRVHSLLLPQMVDQLAREAPDCRFDTTDGWMLEDNEVLSPNWRFIAACSRGRIFVREADTGRVRREIEGCAPAWRPRFGNRLTWAHGETIYDKGRALLDRADLHALVRRHPNIAQLGIPFRVVVTDLAWLDVDHLIVSLQIRARYVPRDSIAVLLEGKTVIGQATTFQGPLDHWFTSSAGSFAAATDGTMLTAGGERFARPDQLTSAWAVAFSPDERWLAYVTGRSIYLVGTPANTEPGRIIRLPIPARDLAWERITTTPTFPRAIR